MKQINNGYANYYYLTEEGQVINIETGRPLKHTNYVYTLRTSSNSKSKVSVRTLYQLVFNQFFVIDQIQNLPEEEWKPISDTDNLYWISSKGRIKSYQSINAKLLKPRSKDGYNRVDIILSNGTRSSRLVSHLVADAFLPLPQEHSWQIHHIDLLRNNDDKTNLVWLSPVEHRKIHTEINRKRRENERI